MIEASNPVLPRDRRGKRFVELVAIITQCALQYASVLELGCRYGEDYAMRWSGCGGC